jgi:hypothetical protein
LTLAVDTTSYPWILVREYVKERIVELTAVCVSVESTDRMRLEAAIRIAELQDLLSAPTRTREAVSRMLEHKTTEVY